MSERMTDAALADSLMSLASTFHPEHDSELIDLLEQSAAALRARPLAVGEVENYSADLTAARDFRITASPDLSDYVLQWQIMDGKIMTVTSIKISREGLSHTIGVIDRVRELLPLAASQSATGGAT